MKLLIFIFIIFSSLTGSLKNVFSKKYIYDTFPTIQLQLLTSFIKLFSNLIIFLSLFTFNKLFSKNIFDNNKDKILNKKQLFFVFIGVFISSTNSFISKEIFKKSDDYTFTSILLSIFYIIFSSLFDIFYLQSKINYNKILSIIWLVVGILFLYFS